ncbi:hypothetical protein EIP86_004557 [Pleurotus ostreatoroseus]|nr:hypothetical protein EIP86_004557 [Pleurotus ostreatoroseus]
MSTTASDGIKTMFAYRFKPDSVDPVKEEIPVPTIAPDEVLVQVLASGVCHSDLSVLNPNNPVNHAMKSALRAPGFTMGHEGAGIIVALGSAVSDEYPQLSKGTYVAVYAPNACLKPLCVACVSGRTNLCRVHSTLGLGNDGSWAPYVAVRAASAIPIPADPQTLLPAVAAIATDAVVTPYHALRTSVKEGQIVLCLGTGGVGLNAVAIAKSCCGASSVVACDVRESSRTQAMDAGADHVTHPDDLLKYLAEKNIFVDVAIDFVGTQTTFELCFAALRPGGTINLIGFAGPPLQVNPLITMSKDLNLRILFWGTRDELVEVLQAIVDGKLKPKVETRPMSECVQVLQELREGKLKNRVVLIP